MRYKSPTRVLALNLHPRRFGYVVVENPERLLDWGVRRYRRKGNAADVFIRRRLMPLLESWRPSVVVLREPLRIGTPNSQRNRLLKQIMMAAKDQRARVQILKQRPTDRAEKLTKYERAQAVVKRFPVLTQKVPPKRKPWESEHYSMSIFEALAMAAHSIRTKSRCKLAFSERLVLTTDGDSTGVQSASPGESKWRQAPIKICGGKTDRGSRRE